jgi:hypothetical protein
MKPAILSILALFAFRACDLFTPPARESYPVVCEFSLTNDSGVPTNVFKTGESFDLTCQVHNGGAVDKIYVHTGPSLFFEIWRADSVIVSSIEGLAWIQVVLVDTLGAGKTDIYHWRAPWTPARQTPLILPPGSYRAHVVAHYGFTDGFLLRPADIPFTVEEQTIPEWVRNLIARFESEPVGSPPQSIWEYSYHGATVYYVPPQCCDQFSTLYDENGAVMCAPDGGIAGGGDGQCPDFRNTRSNERLIWIDGRSRK